MSDPKAIEEVDRLYRFIGEYVIVFQWLEGKLDEIILLARGTENWAKSQHWLAGKTNFEKIEVWKALALSGEALATIRVDDWGSKVEDVAERLHLERKRRNGILHAQFLFDFLVVGEPVIRSNIKRQDGEPHFDQEGLSPERCDEILLELSTLGFDLGLIISSLRSLSFTVSIR